MIGGGLQTPCDIAFKLLDNKGSVIFDGTNDFVDASTVSSRISKLSGTISHWARITASANNEVLFSCSDGTSGNDKIQTVFMTNTSSGQFQAVYKAGGTAYKATHNFAAASIPSQGWFHLAMTYDKVDTDLTIKLYFNGALQNTFSDTADTIGESVTFDRVILGKNANADNSYLTGYIDECAYFSRVLSATEIARIYNEKGKFNYAEDLDLTGSANALKQWLRFGDGILDEFPYINDMNSPNLAEITSTNLVTHSTDLDLSFSKSNVTLEKDAIISPDGTQNASYVKATSATSVHLISDVLGTNDFIAMSIHAKQGGDTRFRFNSGSSSNGFASFNIANGTVVSTGGTYFYNADIEDVGNGWYRCKMVLIGSPGTGMTVAIEDDAGQVSYTGETGKGIYFWGAQGEVQRQVTPLITTTGSTVTRTATIENNYASMINMSASNITDNVPS